VKRIPIADRREIVLKPIESAIDGLVKRNEKFETELENDPINLRVLQSLLQGSVLALVNDGPIVICRSFLDEVQDEPEHILRLQQLLRDFLRFCEESLAVYKRLIGSDQLDFHQALQEGYNKLSKEMVKFLLPRKLKKAKSKFLEEAQPERQEKRHHIRKRKLTKRKRELHERRAISTKIHCKKHLMCWKI